MGLDLGGWLRTGLTGGVPGGDLQRVRLSAATLKKVAEEVHDDEAVLELAFESVEQSPVGATRDQEIGAQVLAIAKGLISAVGAVGLIGVLGGAILYVRFAAADIPPDRVVAVTPHSDLVVYGASVLVGFIIVGLLAVLVVYAIAAAGHRRHGLMYVGLSVVMGVELIATLWASEVDGPWGETTGRWLFTVLVVLGVVAGTFVMAAIGNAAASPDAPTGVVRSESSDFETPVASNATAAPVPTAATTSKVGQLLGWIKSHRTTLFWSLATIETLAGPVVLSRWADYPLVLTWVAIMVLGTAVYAVARATASFAVLAVAVFISVAGVGAIFFSLRAEEDPRVQSYAGLRKEGAPITGVFVAEDDKHVYIGFGPTGQTGPTGRTGPDESRPGEVVTIPNTDITASAVGEFATPDQALIDARSMAAALKRQVPAPPEEPQSAVQKVVCRSVEGTTTETRSFELKLGPSGPSGPSGPVCF